MCKFSGSEVTGETHNEWFIVKIETIRHGCGNVETYLYTLSGKGDGDNLGDDYKHICGKEKTINNYCIKCKYGSNSNKYKCKFKENDGILSGCNSINDGCDGFYPIELDIINQGCLSVQARLLSEIQSNYSSGSICNVLLDTFICGYMEYDLGPAYAGQRIQRIECKLDYTVTKYMCKMINSTYEGIDNEWQFVKIETIRQGCMMVKCYLDGLTSDQGAGRNLGDNYKHICGKEKTINNYCIECKYDSNSNKYKCKFKEDDGILSGCNSINDGCKEFYPIGLGIINEGCLKVHEALVHLLPGCDAE